MSDCGCFNTLIVCFWDFYLLLGLVVRMLLIEELLLGWVVLIAVDVRVFDLSTWFCVLVRLWFCWWVCCLMCLLLCYLVLTLLES